MDTETFLTALFLFLIVVVPILGATARFALLPVIEALIRLRESTSSSAVAPSAERWMLQLESQLTDLSAEVQRLSEAEVLLSQLVSPGDPDNERWNTSPELAPARRAHVGVQEAGGSASVD